MQADWLHDVRSQVNRHLADFLESERHTARDLAPESAELVHVIESLTLRGGKRLRPAVLTAAFRAVAPDRPVGDVVEVAAALELLQTYLLIHDDWMDRDDERRGGPSAHVMLTPAGRDPHIGASLAILAGDLACSLSWKLMTRATARAPAPTGNQALRVFVSMQQEVVFGQQLDLIATDRVALMHQLKTGSYTIRGPLLLGAALGEASEAQRAALLAFGRPLGQAFQLRDDLLGAFGNPASTGKPAGNDLRAGKRTALISAAEHSLAPADRERLSRVFGRRDAPDHDVKAVTEMLSGRGPRAAVEQELHQLVDQAKAALKASPLSAPGKDMLGQLADRISVRDR